MLAVDWRIFLKQYFGLLSRHMVMPCVAYSLLLVNHVMPVFAAFILIYADLS